MSRQWRKMVRQYQIQNLHTFHTKIVSLRSFTQSCLPLCYCNAMQEYPYRLITLLQTPKARRFWMTLSRSLPKGRSFQRWPRAEMCLKVHTGDTLLQNFPLHPQSLLSASLNLALEPFSLTKSNQFMPLLLIVRAFDLLLLNDLCIFNSN